MCIRDSDKGVKLLLPVDTVCADHFGADAAPVVYEAGKIPADMMGMDIGPKTVEPVSYTHLPQTGRRHGRLCRCALPRSAADWQARIYLSLIHIYELRRGSSR